MSQPIKLVPSINRHKLASLLLVFWTVVFFLLTLSTIINLHDVAYRQAETAVHSEAFFAGRCVVDAYNKPDFEIEKCKQSGICDKSWSCRQLDEKLYDNTADSYVASTLFKAVVLYTIGAIVFFWAGRTGLSLLEALITGAIAGWRDFRKWITN
jgi:hypothetical protein